MGLERTEPGSEAASPHPTKALKAPLTATQAMAFAICGVGMFFDALELSMSTAFATVFRPDDGYATGEVGLLISAAIIGAAVGAPILGAVADRFGRRPAMAICLAGFGVLSLVCANMPDLQSLTVARFASALFIGAYQPVMSAYLVEVMPPGKAPQWILLTSVPAGLGAASSMFLSAHLASVASEGWRGALYVGGFGGLLVAALTLFVLRESPQWLLSKRQSSPEALAPQVQAAAGEHVASLAASLLQSGLRGRLAFFLGLEFLAPWALSFLMLQGPLFAARGHAVRESLSLTGWATLGVPAGAILASVLVARSRRRHWLIAAGGALLAVLSIAFAGFQQAGASVAIAGAFNLLVGSYVLLILIYGAELFPSEVRARATTLAYATNRLTAAMIPLVLLPLLHNVGEWAPLGIIALTQVAALVLVIAYVPQPAAGREQ